MSYSELKQLKEEEKVLTEIASKFNDQLNRLKVEELALINQLRAKRDEEAQSETTDATDFLMDDEEKSMDANLDAVGLLEELDLAVHDDDIKGEYEEEDDDDEYAGPADSVEREYEDDLTVLMRQINSNGSHYH